MSSFIHAQLPTYIDLKAEGNQASPFPSFEKETPDIEPYAFIRFSNEAITMKASLDSIVPFFKKGVLVYHELLPGVYDDGSIAIAKEFVKNNPGFKLVKYPLPVIFHDSVWLAQNLFINPVCRYWLLDAYYNYAYLHLEQLARENGDLDRAWLMKVDLDHIYSQKLLNTMLEKVKTLYPHYDTFFMGKFNVVPDYRDRINSSLLGKLFKGNKIPKKMWFESYSTAAYDHFFCKLDRLRNFIFVFTRPPETDLESMNPIYRSGKYGCCNWERCVFQAATYKPYQEHVFITSLHYHYEKNIHYSNQGKKVFDGMFETGHPYQGFPEEMKEKYKLELEADPEFFEAENLIRLSQSFNYPWISDHNRKSDPAIFNARLAADFKALLADPELHVDAFLGRFNTARNTASDEENRKRLDIEADILRNLFHKKCETVELYHGMTGD